MRDAEDVVAEIDRSLTGQLPDWQEAIALIEADRREAKLEVLRRARDKANQYSVSVETVVTNMIAELESGATTDD